MIKKIRLLPSLFLLSLILFFTGCYGSWNFFYEGNDTDKRITGIKSLTAEDDKKFADSGIASLSGKYTVLILSDTHFGNKNKDINTAKLFAWLDSVKGSEKYPSFAICLGDATDLGRLDELDLYLAFCKKLEKDYNLKLVLNACGNHDIYQNNWENWERDCYPHTSFYKFKTEKLSWYCLDTASGVVGIKQYNYLISEFKKDSRKKIVFTHYPVVQSNFGYAHLGESTERNLLISDFMKNNVICVLGGHNHVKFNQYVGFYDYGLPSFGYSEDWGLLNVDESQGTATLDFID